MNTLTPGPAASTVTSGAGSTSGATSPTRAVGRAPAVGRNRAGAVRGVAGQSVQPGFSQRASGATVGTTSRGGQAVFGTSSAKASGKGKAAKASRGAATAPSTRAAAGDLWSGFEPQSRSSVFAAEASAPRDGVGAPVALLAALGLGLAGAAGAMSFAMVRSRRRAKSRATGGSGTTEM